MVIKSRIEILGMTFKLLITFMVIKFLSSDFPSLERHSYSDDQSLMHKH